MPNSTIPKILTWRSSNDAATTTSHHSRLLFSSNLIHPVSIIRLSLSLFLLFHLSIGSAHFYVQRAFVPRNRHISIQERNGPSSYLANYSREKMGRARQLFPGNQFIVTEATPLLYIDYSGTWCVRPCLKKLYLILILISVSEYVRMVQWMTQSTNSYL